MAKYILASQSPRRKQLLEWAEVDFEILVHPTDESYPQGLAPKEVAIHIATEKARAVLPLANNKTVIAADTIVVLGQEIIGKPKDREDAIAILSKLSGQHHQVITGVSIMNADKEVVFADVTDVEFHSLDREQLIFYVDKYKPYDKAGAYAIQEWIGVVGIKRITGDFYNVMGLPVSRVVQALQQFQ
ncbi:MAG TPA: Maf family nucleotide pyrophosphatase [Flavisolibacter sp.]|nr:Maf family nucleotide pyrophosphatase [Flavisolibacter sp.]